MKVFSASFKGVWLQGDAIVVAETRQEALLLLKHELAKQNLGQNVSIDDLYSIDATKPNVLILNNGDY